MESIFVIVLGCLIVSKISCDEIDYESFPKNLKFGVATSALQIEGAWNVSGKGMSNWDWWTRHCPACITDHNTVDDTCKSYYKYKEDVKFIKSIGWDYYRFSISWSRILPNGFANKINKEGLRYYKNLTDELLANRIEPVVTLYHFDHPQILEEMGGWTNSLMIEWYADYVRTIFEHLGPSVKKFITINEPHMACRGYKDQTMSPGKKIVDGVGFYLCIHNMLKAHARAYRMYDEEFRPTQHGQIGLTIPCAGFVLDETNDTASADKTFQFDCGMIGHPIYKGDYPPVVKTRMALVSKARGYKKSRLPTFSPEWISYINGTADYFGLNHYSSRINRPDPDDSLEKPNSDSGIRSFVRRNWTRGSSDWQYVVPEGFRNLLCKIKEEYKNPPVYIFENGYADHGELKDYDRMDYFHDYLKQLILAVKKDGCRVLGYTVWSLMDNYELNHGFTIPFGILQVNFNSTNKERTPKYSAYWWKHVLRTRRLQRVSRE